MNKPTLRLKNGRNSDLAVLRGFGAAALVVALAELALCFAGPIAFIRKPSLMLFPPFSEGVEEKEVSRAAAFLEREIAMTNSYSIVSRTFMLNDSVRRDPDFDVSRLSPADAEAARETARELGLERYGTANIYRGEEWSGISVWIRDTRDGETIRSGTFGAESLEKVMEEKSADLRKALSVETRGMGLTDFIVLALIGLQILLGVLALTGKDPGALAEIIPGTAAILFIFAFIYAKSANMDYVQRYIAMSGQIQLARSTAQEQLYALLRFGPMLAVNIALYIWRNLRLKADAGKESVRGKPGIDGILRSIAWWAFPWTAVSALLFALSFPSFLSLEGVGILAWIALVPFLLVVRTARPGMAVFYGIFFGTLQALIINFWHGTYDYVTLHLITIVFVADYLLFMLVLVPMIRMSGKWGFLFTAAAWTIFDYFRSIGVLAYPWGLIGTSQYKFLPFIQGASITGVWGLGFLVILCNAALAWVPELRPADPGKSGTSKTFTANLFPLKIAATVLAFWLAAGALMLRQTRETLYGETAPPRATIVLIQPNFDARKYVLEDNIRELRALTDTAVASLPEKPDLVAWPEGEFEVDIRYWTKEENRDSHWGRIVQELLDYQKKLGAPILTGTLDYKMAVGPDGKEERISYNSSVLIGPEGKVSDFYHKINLVPFSEYFPLDKEEFPGLYELFDKYEISHWGVGEKRLVFQHEKMRIATPICFEDVFSDHVRRFVLSDVDVILNLGNDYWSLSPVEGMQHGIFAIFRSVENRRPVLRCTASGYTVYADAAGAIQPGALEHYTPGYLVARVPLPEKTLTFYTRHGDWFPLLCGATVAVFFLYSGFRRARRRGD